MTIETTDNQKPDPLDRVFWDSPENRAFRQEIADLMLPYIELTHDGSVGFTKRYFKMNLQGKVYLYLMGRWVLHAKDIRPEGATAKEIGAAIDAPRDSIRPTLMRLMNENMVSKSGEWGHYIYRALPGQAWKIRPRRYQR